MDILLISSLSMLFIMFIPYQQLPSGCRCTSGTTYPGASTANCGTRKSLGSASRSRGLRRLGPGQLAAQLWSSFGDQTWGIGVYLPYNQQNLGIWWEFVAGLSGICTVIYIVGLPAGPLVTGQIIKSRVVWIFWSKPCLTLFDDQRVSRKPQLIRLPSGYD